MIRPPFVNTPAISPGSPAHYVPMSSPLFLTAANGVTARFVYPFAGGARLVDMLVHQADAGVGGTSYTVDVKNVAGTSLLATLPVSTLASGASKGTDAKGDVALPSGWTRPVLKTDATVTVAKGDRLNVSTVETGTYSTHATVVVVLVFEPLV